MHDNQEIKIERGPLGKSQFGLTVGEMKRLREIRKARKLTQVELGRLAGCNASIVSILENGKTNVTLRTIGNIAAALGVQVHDLFADRTEAEQFLIETFRRLPPDRQEGWLDMARAAPESR